MLQYDLDLNAHNKVILNSFAIDHCKVLTRMLIYYYIGL